MSGINNKAVVNPVDLSQLSFPGVIETLDFEAIVAQMIGDLRDRNPAYTSIVESDPAYALMQVFAYREVLLRQRINDAAKANMLAFAIGADLDHQAALLGVARLPGEDDTRLRARAQLAVESYTTAGPVGAYTYHGLTASEDVKDIDVASPSPGEVVITVLSHHGDGTPDPDLLAVVDDALSGEFIRPLTDHVTVQAARIVPYQVEATLYLYAGPDAEQVRALAKSQATAYLADHHRLGHDIAISGLHRAMHIEGAVQRVEVTAPSETLVIAPHEAGFNTELNLAIGGMDE